jgi:flagellar hook protein FlgE
MIGSLVSGVSSLKSFTRGLEVVGNNIANVNTVGFKASRAEYNESFSNVLSRSTPSGNGTSNQPAMQVGSGVKLAATASKFTQGSVSPTGVETDIAITGEGFFQVRDAVSGNEFVTRAGNLRIDDRGYLVSASGHRVQGLVGGSLSYDVTGPDADNLTFTPTLPATAPSTVGDINMNYLLDTTSGTLTNSSSASDADVNAAAPSVNGFSFSSDGSVNMQMSDGNSFALGQVLLTDFSDPQALVREGDGLFSGFDAAGKVGGAGLSAAQNTAGTNGLGQLQSGALELSNVDLTEEFSNIITTQRSFQAGARVVTVSDEILNEVVNLKR